MLKSWLHRLRRVRPSRQVWLKMGYYALVAALLILLGQASKAYRRGGIPKKADAVPEATAAPIAASVFQIASQPEPTPIPAVYVWPLRGEIAGEYAPNGLVWSSTLGQWQTHPALDIAGAPGEAVYACADGEVTDAWEDGVWGNVIEIAHADGLLSRYASLNTLNMVEIGQKVAAGEVIGAVGRSAACESELGWHLHFEVEKAGRSVDFAGLAGEMPEMPEENPEDP